MHVQRVRHCISDFSEASTDKDLGYTPAGIPSAQHEGIFAAILRPVGVFLLGTPVCTSLDETSHPTLSEIERVRLETDQSFGRRGRRSRQ